MRRKHLKSLKMAGEEVSKYERSSKRKLSDNPQKGMEILMKTMFKDSSPGGISIIPTIGKDEEYTMEKPGDLRPVVFSMVSKSDRRLYYCSAIFAKNEAMVNRIMLMDPFPVDEETWKEIEKGDVLDVLITTLFNYEGKPYSFHKRTLRGREISILIKNGLDMTVPPEYQDKD